MYYLKKCSSLRTLISRNRKISKIVFCVNLKNKSVSIAKLWQLQTVPLLSLIWCLSLVLARVPCEFFIHLRFEKIKSVSIASSIEID